MELSPYLQQEVLRLTERFIEKGITLSALSHSACIVLAMSQFVSEQCWHHPDWLIALQETPPNELEHLHYAEWLADALSLVRDEVTLMQTLRLFRQRMMVRIAWAQTLKLYATEMIVTQLSQLAEVLIVQASDWLYQQMCGEFGTPMDAQQQPQPFLILAMGKLGGKELNFSSDVDLIFAYPSAGHTKGARRTLSHQQFFTRLGQRLIRVLNQQTHAGFVYRIDMRLRPFGDSGPLVFSFAALEEYYQEQGREWERYAMIKARVLGDNSNHYAQSLLHLLRPFVYRRYLDFSVIQALRNMKSMIAREVRRRQCNDNIKLGAGGIREIEFIVQTFQLIRGGREPTLQQPNLLRALIGLDKWNLLDTSQVHRLKHAYLFLRRLENLLQAIDDNQNQTLPTNPLDQARLAYGMGYTTWPALVAQIQTIMQYVHQQFNQLIGEEEEQVEHTVAEIYKSLWFDELENDELQAILVHLGRKEVGHLMTDFVQFKQDVLKRTMGQRAREILDKLMPLLLQTIFQLTESEQVLMRLLPLLLNIVTRTTYLELLVENPPAQARLIQLSLASPMIVQQLTAHPHLLDELLYPATLYQPLALHEYRSELQQYLLRVPMNDDEQRLELLRQFKQIQLLHIAAADSNGSLPIMKVSDHLTYLAEAIIAAVVELAWEQITKRYGRPNHLTSAQDKGFVVIAYGKLGGIELGYGSDLDLVFLHNCPPQAMTDGDKSINGRQFYTRLTQRIIHLFSVRTLSGVLYDVDARLRPSGEAGLLVSTWHSFAEYQRNHAWTWEHQALVRARAVYGDAELIQAFTHLRQQIIGLPRIAEWLQYEVTQMRHKMQQSLAVEKTKRRYFSLKQDRGGIIDIEFIAQYLVLRYAHEHPNLARWSDNIRIFHTAAECGIMSQHEATQFIAAYSTMRNEIHHLALQQHAAELPTYRLRKERDFVNKRWQYWLIPPLLLVNKLNQ